MNSKILIVEDDANLLEALRYNMCKEGYDPFTASDGVEALETARRDKPDLIILDIRMPKMDGFETMGHILKSKIDSPIIIHSAYSGYKNHPLTMAADAYVVKSHNFTQLNEAISEVLGMKDPISAVAGSAA